MAMSPWASHLAVSAVGVLLFLVIAAAGFLVVIVLAAVILALIQLVLPTPDGDPPPGDPRAGAPEPEADPGAAAVAEGDEGPRTGRNRRPLDGSGDA